MAESVDDEKPKKIGSEDASDDGSSKEGDAEKPEKKKNKTLSELKNSSMEESLENGDSSAKAVDKPSSSPEENTRKIGSEDAGDDGSSEEGDAEKPEKKKNKTLSELKNSGMEESYENGDSSAKAAEKPSTSPEENPKTPYTQIQQLMGSRTLFVGNLSFSVEQADVENFFQTAGEIVGIRFSMSSDGAFRGFAYIEFASVEAANKALEELNGRELLRRPVRLDIAREPYTPHGSGDQTQLLQGGRAHVPSIFIRGFNKHDGEEQIRTSLEEHFSSCGEIIKLSIPKDQDGGIKGIAYLDFKDNDAVKRALELNGSEIGGNTLFVVLARPRVISRDRARGGRGFRGWGGRSGGGWNFVGRFGGRSSRYWNWDENNYFR